ncbi:hypothetical protein PN462_18715 [Spirulina sp. CS-785/01]|nr:hypothetical protein [Spirulina sp. CS-785/01]MDB9315154.1 hypothetical protein [Spirulina sp. CS-785/01]
MYWETTGHPTLTQTHLSQAVTEYSLKDYMWHVARIHQQLRGWL